MHETQQHTGVRYELRRLTDRWVTPLGSEVISTHASEQAALDAYDRQPQNARDGTGRWTYGSYVPNVVVRVDAGGNESPAVRRQSW